MSYNVSAESYSTFNHSAASRWLILSGVLLTLGAAGILLYLSGQMQQHRLASAAEDARVFSESVTQFRNFYTKVIVPRAREGGLEITHRYHDIPAALPLPATFTLDFSDYISSRQDGFAVSLYSDFPFPERAATRSLDTFQQQALIQLRQNPNQPFVQVEEVGGNQVLRYARADQMEAACVGCHNSYPGSPKTDWQVGDLRGVIEIRRSLQHANAAVDKGLMNAALLSAALIITLLILVWYVLGRMRRAFDDKEQANKALLATQEKLKQQIFALNQHAIVSVADPGGNILVANDKFCQISGYSQDELLGQNHRIVNSGLHSRAFFSEMWSTISQGKVWTGQIRNRTKQGDYYWVDATLVPFLDEQGKPYQYIGIRTDITAHKASEAEVIRAKEVAEKARESAEHAKEVAEQANKAKSHFLANMSHEIRTPMNGIIGMTDLALDSDDEQEKKEYLEIVRDSAQSLLVILNDVLDFSKVEAKKLEIERVPVDLASRLPQILGILKQKAAEKKLDLVLEFDPDLPVVMGDPTRLGQVLINLVGNAIKFTAQGEVRIKIELLNQQQECALIQFSVLDTGIGIEADKLDAIFDAFSQADNSVTRTYGGTGLGLSISSQLVSLMGGSLMVESEIHQGSCFMFSLRMPFAEVRVHALEAEKDPVTDSSVTASSVTASSVAIPSDAALETEAVKMRNVRILLVEDNDVNRRLATLFLKRSGIDVIDAYNGEEAVAIYQRYKAEGEVLDLILMDLQMPVMDGLTATRLIRQLEQDNQWSKTPVIAMTANAMQADQDACFAAGMNDYLSKPVDFKLLDEKIQQLLETAR